MNIRNIMFHCIMSSSLISLKLQRYLIRCRDWIDIRSSSVVYHESTAPLWLPSSVTSTGWLFQNILFLMVCEYLSLFLSLKIFFCIFPCIRVQKCADLNQMCTKNLSLLFAPSLFQTDGKGEHEVKIVEDLIDNYLYVFDVSRKTVIQWQCVEAAKCSRQTAAITQNKQPNSSNYTE